MVQQVDARVYSGASEAKPVTRRPQPPKDTNRKPKTGWGGSK